MKNALAGLDVRASTGLTLRAALAVGNFGGSRTARKVRPGRLTGKCVLSLTNAVVGIFCVRGEHDDAIHVNLSVKGSGAALEVLDRARVDLGVGNFLKNGVHIEVVGSALVAADAVFTERRRGVGVFVRCGSENALRTCWFGREARDVLEAAIDGC
jgi:hypothetical protein